MQTKAQFLESIENLGWPDNVPTPIESLIMQVVGDILEALQ